MTDKDKDRDGLEDDRSDDERLEDVLGGSTSAARSHGRNGSEEAVDEEALTGDESDSSEAVDEDPRTDPHAVGGPEDPGTWDRLGATVGALVGATIAGLASAASGFLRELTTFIPYGPRLWRGVMLAAAKNYQKATGADALALSHYQNTILPEPVSFQLPEDVGDRPGWKVHGAERFYDAATNGRDVLRLGRSSVILVDVDNPFSVTPFESRFAEALELDNVRPLIAPGATLRQEIIEIIDGRERQDGAVVADGGENIRKRVVGDTVLDPFSVEEFEGDLVDLSSSPGSDGMHVMAKKVKDTYQETSTVEEMHRQEERGKAALMDKKELRAFMWKVMLVGAAVAIAGLVGKELVYALFGAEQVGRVLPGVVSVLPSLGVL